MCILYSREEGRSVFCNTSFAYLEGGMSGRGTRVSCPRNLYQPGRNIAESLTPRASDCVFLTQPTNVLTLGAGAVAESDFSAAPRISCGEIMLTEWGTSCESVSHAARRTVFPALRNTFSPLLTAQSIPKKKSRQLAIRIKIKQCILTSVKSLFYMFWWINPIFGLIIPSLFLQVRQINSDLRSGRTHNFWKSCFSTPAWNMYGAKYHSTV